MDSDSSAFDSVLLQETQRVLNDQVNIVQEQQKQANRVIRVSLTALGLVLTALSIFISSPLLSNNSAFVVISPESIEFKLIIVVSIFVFLILVLILYTVFLNAIIVLSPESGTGVLAAEYILVLFDTIGKIPFVDLSRENMMNEHQDTRSLRSGLDSEEVQDIVSSGLDADEIRESIVSYNSGCIQGNEMLIETNREFLFSIYQLLLGAVILITLTMPLIAGILIVSI